MPPDMPDLKKPMIGFAMLSRNWVASEHKSDSCCLFDSHHCILHPPSSVSVFCCLLRALQEASVDGCRSDFGFQIKRTSHLFGSFQPRYHHMFRCLVQVYRHLLETEATVFVTVFVTAFVLNRCVKLRTHSTDLRGVSLRKRGGFVPCVQYPRVNILTIFP